MISSLSIAVSDGGKFTFVMSSYGKPSLLLQTSPNLNKPRPSKAK